MLEGLGAEVVLIAQVDGSPGQVTGSDVNAAAQAACAIARARDGFYVDQFNAAEGIPAHETTTGPEILAQFGGPVDGWVAAVGTGCTFVGVAKALKRANPRSEEHTSELQSLMRISYAVFCLNKKKNGPHSTE